MARKRSSRTRKPSKLAKAKKIIRAQVASGNQRATVVQGAVLRAGISLRTYRTARKTMPTVAVRRNRSRTSRGKGAWFVSTH